MLPLGFLVLVAGCVTSPQVFNVERSREYAQSKTVTWDRLIRWFATNNIQVKTIEKDSGIIYAEREVTDASSSWWDRGRVANLADCGKDFWAVPQGQTIQMNVYVKDMGARSAATVNVTFREFYYPYSSGVGFGSPPQTCNSTGAIENRILDELSKG